MRIVIQADRALSNFFHPRSVAKKRALREKELLLQQQQLSQSASRGSGGSVRGKDMLLDLSDLDITLAPGMYLKHRGVDIHSDINNDVDLLHQVISNVTFVDDGLDSQQHLWHDFIFICADSNMYARIVRLEGDGSESTAATPSSSRTPNTTNSSSATRIHSSSFSASTSSSSSSSFRTKRVIHCVECESPFAQMQEAAQQVKACSFFFIYFPSPVELSNMY
jgi:hypothetical protein